MSSDPETTRVVRSWLDEGVTQLPDRVLDAVLDRVSATPQRRAGWLARRSTLMNNLVRVSLAAAAVVAAVLIGAQLFGSSIGGFGGEPEATETPESSVAAPSSQASSGRPAEPSVHVGLPLGQNLVSNDGDAVQVTVDVASSGWFNLPELDVVSKHDDGLDAPQSVGVALLAWTWPAGTGFTVYGDPCDWSSTAPETPATTPDEIAAAFAAQDLTDPSAPVDVTVGGYEGKAVTVQVPLSFEVPGATREEEFADCDESTFAFYGAEPEAVARNAQGPGQIDELWILDVEGSIVILDATYGPAAPTELVEELRALAESATFEIP